MSADRLPPPGRRVVLHVGAPKTGTTYLQERLRSSATQLAEQGVHVPRSRWWQRWNSDPSFRAALDLLDQDWGGPPGHARGAWPKLLQSLGPHTTVISHELLAGARQPVVDRALSDLEGTEVHVVYTARDLARALPAAWQESLKQGRTWSYRRFLARARRDRLWFMRALDFPAVLDRWGGGLSPQRVHLVVVPRSGSEPGLLWSRFCRALGVDPQVGTGEATHVNTSLGVPEAQLLRLLNLRLGGKAHRRPERAYLIGNLLAEKVLSERETRPLRLPPRVHPWVVERTEEWLSWARDSGIDVIGDLDELRPAPTPAGEWVNPDRVRPRQVLDASLDALVASIEEAQSRSVPLGRRVQARLQRAKQTS